VRNLLCAGGLGLSLGLAGLAGGAATAQPAPGCQAFPQTGHTVCGAFLTYWQGHGGLAQQGYPLSDEFTEVSDQNGQSYTVPYFERAVFEKHPENQPPYDVLLSQLGTFRARRKYPNGFPGMTPPTPAPPPGVGVKVPLRAGVTIQLRDDLRTGSSLGPGVGAPCGGDPRMMWVFSLTNTSNSSYTINVDRDSLRQVDSTGKTYPPIKYCFVDALYEAFAVPTTLTANRPETGEVTFDARNIPPQATYLEMSMTLSGTPLTFRWSLR
jgi:hypothetical protein